MRSRVRIVVFVSAVVAAACHANLEIGPRSEAHAIKALVGDTFSLAIGEEATIVDTRVRVRLEDVTNDSRCPSDVQCVWAGNATLRVRIMDDTTFVVALNTITDPRDIRFGNFMLRVEDLRPYAPKSSEKIEKAAYRATFVVSSKVPLTRLSVAEIGQISEAVIDDLIPPGTPLSQISVDQRGINFAVAETMTAFGRGDSAGVSLEALGIRRAMQVARGDLIADCRQMGGGCARLGSGVLVRLYPTRVSSSEALVWGFVGWPERGYLASFASEVYLARGPDGKWRVVKRGKTSVG